ncbi:hypothetical protein ACGE24_07625 [Corynebacterium kroppenstedtii]|uniref:hypothetical protein n=1 Tax=Corynebacterium sp. PCR 32 TaxID=3351342 RepID=UPI0030AC4C88
MNTTSSAPKGGSKRAQLEDFDPQVLLRLMQDKGVTREAWSVLPQLPVSGSSRLAANDTSSAPRKTSLLKMRGYGGKSGAARHQRVD